MQPKISVLIPVHNGAKYLPECLQSVREQTFTDFEIICINDGSTDRTLEILRQWQQKEPRLHVITQPNAGVATTRNRLLQEAKGEYIAFVDADDKILPQYLEKLYQAATSTHADITRCCLINLSEDGSQFFPAQNGIELQNSTPTLQERFACGYVRHEVWAKLFRATFVRAQGLQFYAGHHAEDVSFTLLAHLLANQIAFVPEELYLYRWEVSGSIMGQRQLLITLDVLQELLIVWEELQKRGLADNDLANLWIKKTMWRLAICRKLPKKELQQKQYVIKDVFQAIDGASNHCRFIPRLRWKCFCWAVKRCGQNSIYKWAKLFR